MQDNPGDCVLVTPPSAHHNTPHHTLQVQGQLWEPAIWEQWAAAIATLPLRTAHMGLAGPHDIGMEFIRQVVKESQRMWLLHTKATEGLINTRAGPGGTMAWALRELQLHQQAEQQGVPRAALN